MPSDLIELPIFPLTGTVLLPGCFLPLNIFEPRYLNMVADALDGGGLIGMVQPVVPAADNWGPVPDQLMEPEVYAVGGAGQIKQHEPQPDGRSLILLEGRTRFSIVDELEPRNGYRRARVDPSLFPEDHSQPPDLEVSRLLRAAERLRDEHGLDLDLDLLAGLPATSLLNGLCSALPVAPAEKQALLEAPTAAERLELLLDVLGMTFEVSSSESRHEPPLVN